MIKIEKTEVFGWEHAIRGMRNPMNSWEKSDSWTGCPSYFKSECVGTCKGDCTYCMGENDHKLAMSLAANGAVHAKYRRMISVYADVTAPLYWWKEFDTYKVGTVANSCSTMHKITAKEFTIDDFSYEYLRVAGKNTLLKTIDALNAEREAFVGEGCNTLKGDKQCWYSIIQLLPSSYNQKRTVMLNYETLANIYRWRKDHKLPEWREFCKWIETLPYSELITGGKK